MKRIDHVSESSGTTHYVEASVTDGSILTIVDDTYLAPPSSFVFTGDHGNEIVRVYADGRVVVAEGVTVDEAAAGFWAAVSRAMGQPPPPCRPLNEHAIVTIGGMLLIGLLLGTKLGAWYGRFTALAPQYGDRP